MQLEEKYDAKSTFFFLATEKDPVRLRYNIEDIEEKLGEIKDRGFEIGLHGGYYSYNNIIYNHLSIIIILIMQLHIYND